MGDGGPPHRRLEAIRARYPLSLHGVGLSIGSPRPLDRDHLARLGGLIRRYEPAQFSEHLAWSSHDEGFLADLLPLPYDDETLAVVCRHIDETQETLGLRMLLENPSTYVQFSDSGIAETEFLAEVVAPHRLRPAARRQQRLRQRDQPRLRSLRLSRRFPASPCRRDPSRRLRRRGRRPRRAAADRRPQFAGAGDGVGALPGDARPTRADADADRMGQRRSAMAGPRRRGAPRRCGDGAQRRRQGVAPCRLRRRSPASRSALVDPSRPAPAATRRRDGRPVERRFAVYRNNVAVALDRRRWRRAIRSSGAWSATTSSAPWPAPLSRRKSRARRRWSITATAFPTSSPVSRPPRAIRLPRRRGAARERLGRGLSRRRSRRARPRRAGGDRA